MGLKSRPGSQGKAGSLGPDSSSAATLFCASVSPLVKRLTLPWVEEDPTINTVLPRPHWVALCLPQGARAGRSGLYEKWAPSPLFQKGRHSHLVCDEPWSKWPRARVGQDKTASPRAPPAPGLTSCITPPSLCLCCILCLEASLHTPLCHFFL